MFDEIATKVLDEENPMDEGKDIPFTLNLAIFVCSAKFVLLL